MHSGVRSTGTIGARVLFSGHDGFAAGILTLVVQHPSEERKERATDRDWRPRCSAPGLPLPRPFLVTALAGLVGSMMTFLLTFSSRQAPTKYGLLTNFVLLVAFAPLCAMTLSIGNWLALAAMHLITAIAVTGAIWPQFRRYSAA